MPSAILDPTGLSGKTSNVGLTLAPRPARPARPGGPGGLRGARIGLLENGKQNASRFLTDVADILRERYGAGEATLRRKENFAQPAAPELIDELSRESDVVVIGIGD
jgi:hypothetical protein